MHHQKAHQRKTLADYLKNRKLGHVIVNYAHSNNTGSSALTSGRQHTHQTAQMTNMYGLTESKSPSNRLFMTAIAASMHLYVLKKGSHLLSPCPNICNRCTINKSFKKVSNT